MREIKFRGKRIDNNQWVYGSFHLHQEVSLCIANEEQRKQNTKALILFDGMSDWNLPVPINTCEVYPESVEQFTGLHDKNGKDIYEGDIMQCQFKRTPFIIESKMVSNCGCCSDVYGWEIPSRPDIDSIILDDCVIIGNVFDTVITA